jgi:hypothetical protein
LDLTSLAAIVLITRSAPVTSGHHNLPVTGTIVIPFMDRHIMKKVVAARIRFETRGEEAAGIHHPPPDRVNLHLRAFSLFLFFCFVLWRFTA